MEEKMAEEEKSKNESSGSSEIVEAVVDKAIELDEKTQKRRLTLLNLALQDVKMMDICEEEGVNPRDTFRGFVSGEGKEKRLRIVTSGKEGEEKAKEMVSGLGDSDEWHVKNESVPRVEWKDMRKELNREEEPKRELDVGEKEKIGREIDEKIRRYVKEAKEEGERKYRELKAKCQNML